MLYHVCFCHSSFPLGSTRQAVFNNTTKDTWISGSQETTRMLVAEEHRYMPACHTLWKSPHDGKVQCCHIATYLRMLSELLHSNSSIALCIFITGIVLSCLAALDCLHPSLLVPPYLVFEILLFVSLMQACLKMWFSVLSRDQLSHCWNIRPQSSAHATAVWLSSCVNL